MLPGLLTAPPATPLIQPELVVLWKIVVALSVLLNGLLVYWLLFLPRKVDNPRTFRAERGLLLHGFLEFAPCRTGS